MTTTRVSSRQFNTSHGTFYSLATQAIANVANAQAIALENNSDVHGLTHDTVTNNSRIYVDLTGSYEIIFSGIANLAALPVNKHLEIWIAINGSAVTDSNTRVELVSTNTEMTVAVSWILDVNADSYIELITWGDDTDCQWLATAAGSTPTRPAVPSVIATVKMIGGY